MENWRRKGDKCNQELPRIKSQSDSRKPPLVSGENSWQPSVPSWEKRFVATVGAISWKKFLEAKEYTHIYKNVLEWDDSAGEEAFQIAKDNFHAKIYGFPCDFHPHNPDLYIDQVDWDAKINPNLIQDLESNEVAPDPDRNHEPVVIFGDTLPDPFKNFSPAGWGDEKKTGVCENKTPEAYNNGINYDDYVNNWDVDLGALNSQWLSKENNDDKVQGDQGWSEVKKSYRGWNNKNYYGNVNNGGGRWRFRGDNDHHSWRNNGSRRQAAVAHGHGNQWVHRVHP